MTPRIWLIAGPTASGKSALALALARRIGGEIVGADSMQVYSDLRVLTARPGPDEMALVPHHLVGTVDGAATWSTGRWQRAARQALDEIAARGRPAVVVGGTGLYFRALTDGLADIPDIPVETRAEAGQAFDRDGEAAVRARLGDGAAGISPGDRQRLVRALEVLLATGRPLAAWQAEQVGALDSGAWTGVVVEPERRLLYDQCDARLAAMVDAGALEEVRGLMARTLDPRQPILKAVGVPPFAAHLAGEMGLAEALAAARQDTRRYAKRQLTWLRNQTPDWPRLAPGAPEDQVDLLLASVPER